MADPFDLERFVQAQDAVMGDVRREIQLGRKRTHWMWFVFPQLRALGRSPTAQRYGIASLAEAQAYMAHPVLGPRLVECAELVLAVPGRTAHEIFGSPDDLKLHSSMTLFAAAAPDRQVFGHLIREFLRGQPDPLTTELLAQG
ncbi:DUF1810 domain-containing protein [Falsiroseomonas oryzae]|uniref:DUF1810 domain-containing protein n=1 Tax=Falsiroseomonas oryzae TaxID=2766473 RepID=UPI0022EAC065|nr:DUF1810 domain-containing protein [Roseomonas sp. MO-31]